MSIPILSTFSRVGSKNYPLLEDADVRGGFQVVDTTADRNAIPANLRKVGMHVFVTGDNTTYRLEFNPTAWTSVTAGGGAANTGIYTYPPSMAIRQVACLSGGDAVGVAGADGPGTQPLIGFVASKPSSTQAVIQYSGELSGFSGLIPGATYFLSTMAGQITSTAPTMAGAVVQRVGFARSPTTLVVIIDRDFILP
jgi:hypothetical protein